MATNIHRGPTPKQFATRQTQLFAAAIRELAGKDGRLSSHEASEANIKLTGALRVAIDNIENYFATTGYKRSRLTGMIRRHYEYVYRSALTAADADGRLSSSESVRRLPRDLQDNFYLRRGVLPPKQ